MKNLCKKNNIYFKSCGKLFEDIVTMTVLLSEAQIDYDYIERNGYIWREKWRDETKGFDDYLLQKK